MVTTAIDLSLFPSSDRTGFRIQGEAGGDYSGRSVSAAGDVNGDGFGDVIVGADMSAPNGEAYVIYGKAAGLGTIDLAAFVSSVSTGFRIKGAAAGDGTGISVSAAGDVNRDGFADVIVGAPNADLLNGALSGASYVIFGHPVVTADVDLATFVSGDTTGFRILGAAAGDHSGSSVSAAGDVNNDGFDDVIVGASDASPNGRAGSGESYVIFGRESGFVDVDLAFFADGRWRRRRAGSD